MHGGLVEEALRVWRDGERLLEELPPLMADRETVRLNVVALRETYQTLTSRSTATSDQIVECAEPDRVGTRDDQARPRKAGTRRRLSRRVSVRSAPETRCC